MCGFLVFFRSRANHSTERIAPQNLKTKTVSFWFLGTLGAKVTLTEGKGHNSRINTSISPPFFSKLSSAIHDTMATEQERYKDWRWCCTKLPMSMNSNVLKLVTLTFSRPKEVSTKKTHLIFECFFRNIFNPSFFW